MDRYDIFISYRRSDAEAYAYMLYRDLKSLGYSVFHDHNSLGNGDFLAAIQDAIKACKDVILVLSKDALGTRIWDDGDIMRSEIETALSEKKQIVGIMLPGFDRFPEDLPASVQPIVRINSLSSKMEYYDAMLERLTSGRFLSSVPAQAADVFRAPGKKQGNEIVPGLMKNMSVAEKRGYMKFVMELAHEFNSSQECMRLYKYLDTYIRNRGIRETPPYDGVIPTDYATYLSFFETVYLIVITETLDIVLLDELYRYRFFAVCNNPEVQNSELLPLGYQYPNVLKLYDLWIEYIRRLYAEKTEGMSLMDEIPLYEYDLQKRYALNTFAMNPAIPTEVVFTNRKADRKDLVLCRLGQEHYEEVIRFQERVVDGIDNNDSDNLFESLTEREVHDALDGYCFALMDGTRIAALLSVIPHPRSELNLMLDLETEEQSSPETTMVVDCILVDADYRGFRIQRAFLNLAEFFAKRMKMEVLCAVVSPKNYHSISNFVKAGYQLVALKPKYHSVRNYFVKRIELAEELNR